LRNRNLRKPQIVLKDAENDRGEVTMFSAVRNATKGAATLALAAGFAAQAYAADVAHSDVTKP
jgi:hypothetical protein